MPSYCIANSLAASACKSSGCLAAAFCVIVSLCAAQIAVAEPETAQAERVEAIGAEASNAARTHSPKKKIAIAQFDVTNTIHVNDISNIYDGLPRVLSGRLEASGEFLPVYTGRSIPAEAGEAQRETITRIAEETGAQFLLSGTVVNAGIMQEKGILGTPLGKYKKRHIEVEFAVYDGLTGTRLLLRRLSEQAWGDVMVGNDKPFGSSIFFETELGQALNRLLDIAVKDIRDALENVPFSARVIRAEAKKVVLDAGSDSLLKPGDQLVVYVRDTGAPIVGLNGSALGALGRAADTATLTQVQPQFSIGELPEDAAKLGIKAGNIAKIDAVEQYSLAAKQMEARQMAKAQQEAKDKAERFKAEQAAQAEAARAKAEQDAKAEAARIKAEKKAQAQAKAQAAAEAKAAKLKAKQEIIAARLKAAQEARARERAREKARAAAEARAAKLKAKQEAKAEAECIKVEKKAESGAQAATAAQQPAESGVAKTKTEAEAVAQQAAGSGVAETKTEAEAAAETEAARAKKKPGVPLKLKQIKP